MADLTAQEIKSIERGMRECEVLTEYLNNIILNTGTAIRRDNHGLWKRFFNHYNNEDWHNMITAMELIHDQYPDAFELFHTQAMRTARETLTTHGADHRRVLDTGPYKSQAWRMGMAIREVLNHLEGKHIPNG